MHNFAEHLFLCDVICISLCKVALKLGLACLKQIWCITVCIWCDLCVLKSFIDTR